MTKHRDHPHDDIHLLLDGRLDVDAQARVEAHVAGCRLCRQELEALRWTKRTARGAERVDDAVPPGVSKRILDALDDVDRGREKSPRRAVGSRFLVPALGLVAAAAIAIVVLVNRSHDPVTEAAEDLKSYAASTLALDHRTEAPHELEQFFAAGGLDFPARVFDFGMMNFTLRGGRIHRINGRPSALFAYSSVDGRHIVCQMYRGRLSGLPKGFERHVLGGMEFRSYRRGGAALVVWEEGALVCILASDGDPSEALEFARAKAQAAGI